MDIRQRVARIVQGPGAYDEERAHLAEIGNRMLQAYQDGPYILPPKELERQLREQYDTQTIMDLLDSLQWEQFGSGYQPDSERQRTRAVEDGRRMWRVNPVAQWIIRLWTYYGLGETLEITPLDETYMPEEEEEEPEDDGEITEQEIELPPESAQEVFKEFWEADRNRPVLAPEKMHNISNLLLATGNRFFAFFMDHQEGETTVRRIRPEEIVEIVTEREDDSVPAFYKRQWLEDDTTKVAYYPDWLWYFGHLDEDDYLEPLEDKDGAEDNVAEQDGTEVCMLHVPFETKDEDTLFGWPLLAPAGTPWIRSQRQFMEARLAVARAVAAYVRRRNVKGGSRAVDAVRSVLGSSYQFGGTQERNPYPAPASEDIHNQAIQTQDLPLRTGAGDAKADNESFAWMAGLAGGVFPHYLGLGDAYRLATATAMEKPLEMQFSQYRAKLNAMFRDMARIVLQAYEKYNKGVEYETYEVRIAADRLVALDLTAMSAAVSNMFGTVISPQGAQGKIPEVTEDNVTTYSLQAILQAMGAENVEELVNIEQFEDKPGPPEPEVPTPGPGDAEPEDEEEIAPFQGAEAVEKVQPEGEPLEPWPAGVPVPITPEAIASAIAAWDRGMPEEARGILTARTLTPEEEAQLEGPDA